MKLNQLDSLIAIADHGTFTAAGVAIGLSHSAISLHIKALEERLGVVLIDRSVRPPLLTENGALLVTQARKLHDVLDEIRTIGHGDSLSGTLMMGIVPSVMVHLAPPALATIRSRHPGLTIRVRSGLSGELAHAVRSGDLDAAITTAPDLQPEGLVVHGVARERLVVIAPSTVSAGKDEDLITNHPFIWFSRKTWAGQQIERRLLDRGLRTREVMEVDSLEAVEALVRHGLGVAVVPDRVGSNGLSGLTKVAFGNPQAERGLVMLTRIGGLKSRLIRAMLEALREAGLERAFADSDSAISQPKCDG